MEELNVLLLLTPKKQVSYLEENTNVRQALEKMRAHGYMAIPVLSKTGEYLGSISEGDLLWNIVDEEMDEEYMEETSIMEIIRKDYMPAVKVNVKSNELLQMITIQNYVPIVDDRNILMGIVTRRRVLQEILNKA